MSRILFLYLLQANDKYPLTGHPIAVPIVYASYPLKYCPKVIEESQLI